MSEPVTGTHAITVEGWDWSCSCGAGGRRPGEAMRAARRHISDVSRPKPHLWRMVAQNGRRCDWVCDCGCGAGKTTFDGRA